MTVKQLEKIRRMIAHEIGAVVLDYSQERLTVRCLETILRGKTVPGTIVVVENGTSMRIGPSVACDGTTIVILSASLNLGCAGGRNLAINYLLRNSGIHTVVSLDNDVLVSDEFFFAIQQTPPESVSVQIPIIRVHDSGELWSVGGLIDANGHIEQLRTLSRLNAHVVDVDWGPGAALVFTRETWVTVGPFDYWMNFYCEDIDWCVRVRACGGTLRVRDDLIIYHEPHQSLGGKDSPVRTRLWARNGSVLVLWTLRGNYRSIARWYLSETRDLTMDLVRAHWSQVVARIIGLTQGTVEGLRRLWWHQGAC